MSDKKYNDEVDNNSSLLLDPKMTACIVGIGICVSGLGIPMTILPVVGKVLIHGGIITLGSVATYVSGDLIKNVIKSNNKEVK